LIPTGLLAIGFATSANAFVQLGTEPGLRGRVMAIYTLVFFGGTPFGALLVGWVSQHAGPRWGIIGGGLLTLICTVLLVLFLYPRAGREGASADSGPHGVAPAPEPLAPEDVEAVVESGDRAIR
jgi:MFS family permease